VYVQKYYVDTFRQVLQEKDAMVVRCAEEVVSVKSQAKSAATKFSERARAEKAALQAEIKQFQVKQQTIFLCHSSGYDVFFSIRTLCLLAMQSFKVRWAQERLKETKLPRPKFATFLRWFIIFQFLNFFCRWIWNR
jgi:hypothetical protein